MTRKNWGLIISLFWVESFWSQGSAFLGHDICKIITKAEEHTPGKMVPLAPSGQAKNTPGPKKKCNAKNQTRTQINANKGKKRRNKTWFLFLKLKSSFLKKYFIFKNMPFWVLKMRLKLLKYLYAILVKILCQNLKSQQTQRPHPENILLPEICSHDPGHMPRGGFIVCLCSAKKKAKKIKTQKKVYKNLILILFDIIPYLFKKKALKVPDLNTLNRISKLKGK